MIWNKLNKSMSYQTITYSLQLPAGSTSACNSQLVVELKQVVNEALIILFSSLFANIVESACVVQSALSAMHLSRLHSSTRAPVTASVLLRRSSSRRLLPSPQEATLPTPERRPSLIGTIPETIATERTVTFRRRSVMSLVGKNKKSFKDFN